MLFPPPVGFKHVTTLSGSFRINIKRLISDVAVIKSDHPRVIAGDLFDVSMKTLGMLDRCAGLVNRSETP